MWYPSIYKAERLAAQGLWWPTTATDNDETDEGTEGSATGGAGAPSGAVEATGGDPASSSSAPSSSKRVTLTPPQSRAASPGASTTSAAITPFAQMTTAAFVDSRRSRIAVSHGCGQAGRAQPLRPAREVPDVLCDVRRWRKGKRFGYRSGRRSECTWNDACRVAANTALVKDVAACVSEFVLAGQCAACCPLATLRFADILVCALFSRREWFVGGQVALTGYLAATWERGDGVRWASLFLRFCNMHCRSTGRCSLLTAAVVAVSSQGASPCLRAALLFLSWYTPVFWYRALQRHRRLRGA